MGWREGHEFFKGKGGGCQGPRKGRSVGVFKLTVKTNLGGGVLNPEPPGSATGWGWGGNGVGVTGVYT